MESLKDILREEGFTFSKRFGQNFLTDPNLLRAIAADARVTDRDVVVEIGPGAGGLTAALAERADEVIAFEIDKSLEPVLRRTLAGFSNVEIVYRDVMEIDDQTLGSYTGGDYILAANLPYYITTPVLFRFTESPAPPKIITVMVQEEVAERLTAKPSSAAYGTITASIGLTYRAEITRRVSRRLFTPEPNVDSAVVRLTYAPLCPRPERVRRLIRAAFQMRRKTLANNLLTIQIPRAATEAALRAMDMPAAIRGESLSSQDFINLAAILDETNTAE